MANTTPVFTDYVSVLAAQTLARGSVANATIDLKSRFGASLFLQIGRGGTNALTNGILVGIRKLANDGTNDLPFPGDYWTMLSGTAAANGTTVNADSAAGQKALNVASITGFAAGDIVCVTDAAFARMEFCKVSKTAAGILTMDRNLIFTHTAAQADPVRNKADCFGPVPLEAGSVYEVIVDYGDDAAGDTANIRSYITRYDSDAT